MSSESEMTKETSSGRTPLSIFYRYPRLMQGLSLIGSFGVLSSGLVVAQTNSLVDAGAAPPTAAEEPPVVRDRAAAPAPALEAAPEPAARPRPAAPEPFAPEAPAYKPAPQRVPYAETKPAAPSPEPAPYSQRKPEAAPPQTYEREKPRLAAPHLSVPDASTVAQPPKVILNPTQIPDRIPTPFESTNTYIDRTDYGIGATPRYEGPASVVLADRATGCQTVSQNGQLSSGVCGVVASSQQVANQQAANSGRAILEPKLLGVPRLPTPTNMGSVSPSPLRAGDSFIRGTQQTAYANRLPAAPSGSSYYPSGSAANSLAYYNLTTRPTGRPNIGKNSFMFPLAIPAAITSIFGWRIHPITGQYRFHSGTDLGAPEGTPVLAAVSGQVVTADFLGGYGLTVVLQHQKGQDESLYAHLSEIFVKPGDMVEQGNVIGRVGSTGNSTGPHLHFEWRHLTSNGWVTVDAGTHLEFALAQFIRALQVAQAAPQRGT